MQNEHWQHLWLKYASWSWLKNSRVAKTIQRSYLKKKNKILKVKPYVKPITFYAILIINYLLYADFSIDSITMYKRIYSQAINNLLYPAKFQLSKFVLYKNSGMPDQTRIIKFQRISSCKSWAVIRKFNKATATKNNGSTAQQQLQHNKCGREQQRKRKSQTDLNFVAGAL